MTTIMTAMTRTEVTMHDESRDGFAGTVRAFLAWLQHRLVYGGVIIGDPAPAEPPAGKLLVRRVEMITGGYCDDEALLDRVQAGSMFSHMYWRSTHRGGLYIYEVPVEGFESDQEITWLGPASDVCERPHGGC